MMESCTASNTSAPVSPQTGNLSAASSGQSRRFWTWNQLQMRAMVCCGSTTQHGLSMPGETWFTRSDQKESPADSEVSAGQDAHSTYYLTVRACAPIHLKSSPHFGLPSAEKPYN